MAGGYFKLGEMIAGGGIDRDTAYLQGLDKGSQINLRKAQTDNALAQARQRQQEAAATAKLGDALEAAGLDRRLAPIVASGHGSDFNQMMTGRETQQSMDFRDVLADPTATDAARQGAGLAIRGEPVTASDVLGPGGELSLPGLFQGTFDPGVTSTGTAQIGADNALANQRNTAAALNQAKIDHPEQYFPAGAKNANPPVNLSDAILPGGEGTTIVPPDIDASEGFGAKAQIKNVINGLVDWAGGGAPFPDTNIATNTLAELSARTQIAMRADVPGGRPPLIVQELLGRYAEDPAQLFRGDDLARTNLATTLASLTRSRDRIKQIIDSPTKKTPTRQGELEDSYLSLSDTIADYEAIIASLDAKYGPLTQGQPPGLGEAATAPDTGGEWQTTPGGTRYRVVTH